MYKKNYDRKPFGRFSPRKRAPQKRASFSQNIHVSRFINKAVERTQKEETFTPSFAFADLKIASLLKSNIRAKGFISPTPIQDKIIPYALEGKDVVGIANTGTGKTGAFLIPLIQKILLDEKKKVLIVAPTRELAAQINQEFVNLVRGSRIFSVCCVGGAPINRQIMDLRRRTNFIIGTPGRLKDLVERKKIFLAEFSTIVLDEADRMLDMGFIDDIRFIMAAMPKERHTLLFSATMSSRIESLIKDLTKDPISISVKTAETAENVDQDVVRTAGNDKLDMLQGLLIEAEFKKVLIFGRTKSGVERLSRTLIERGFKAESIHGDKNYFKRQQALRLFKEERVQILVATDVAARGLDIPNVSHVINYDIPATYDDYVHRIGRTGRGDKKGKALTFVE